jgi:hypothetical protein
MPAEAAMNEAMLTPARSYLTRSWIAHGTDRELAFSLHGARPGLSSPPRRPFSALSEGFAWRS